MSRMTLAARSWRPSNGSTAAPRKVHTSDVAARLVIRPIFVMPRLKAEDLMRTASYHGHALVAAEIRSAATTPPTTAGDPLGRPPCETLSFVVTRLHRLRLLSHLVDAADVEERLLGQIVRPAVGDVFEAAERV